MLNKFEKPEGAFMTFFRKVQQEAPSIAELMSFFSEEKTDTGQNQEISFNQLSAALQKVDDIALLGLIGFNVLIKRDFEDVDNIFRNPERYPHYITWGGKNMVTGINNANIFRKFAKDAPTVSDRSDDIKALEMWMKQNDGGGVVSMSPTIHKLMILSRRIAELYPKAAINSVAKNKEDNLEFKVMEEFFGQLAAGKGTYLPTSLQDVISNYSNAPAATHYAINLSVTAINKIEDISYLALTMCMTMTNVIVRPIIDVLTAALPPDDRAYGGLGLPPETIYGNKELAAQPIAWFNSLYKTINILSEIARTQTVTPAQKDFLNTMKGEFINQDESRLLKQFGIKDGREAVAKLGNINREQIKQQFGDKKELLELLFRLGIKGAIELIGSQQQNERNSFRAMLNRLIEIGAKPTLKKTFPGE